MTNDSSAAPVVSVIVRAVYAHHDVAATLSSVDDQTFSDRETIVVTDRNPNGLNAAVSRSRGRYLAFLDAGDLWAVNFLERQVSYLDAHPWCQLVYSDANLCGESRIAGRRFMQQSPPAGRVTLVNLVEGRCPIPFSTVLARHEAVVAAGAFDDRLDRRQEAALWLRLAQRGAFIACQREVLADCRVTSNDSLADLQQTLEVLEHFSRHYVLSADVRRALQRRSMSLLDRIDIELAKRYMLDGNFRAATYHLAASRTHSLTLLVALLALRVAPRATRRLFMAARAVHVEAAAVFG